MAFSDTESRRYSSGRRWRRRLLLLAIPLAVLAILVPQALPGIGHWLMVEDDLRSADVIFVHGGHLPFRSMEAAELYQQQLAQEIWLAPVDTTLQSAALLSLGIEMPTGHYWRRLVLERLGVPSSAIVVLDTQVLSTRDEVEAVAFELERRGWERVVLVTSKQHSRRVRALWSKAVDSHLEAVVRWSRSDPFEPDSWWRDPRSSQAVVHELAGLLALWMGADVPPKGDEK